MELKDKEKLVRVIGNADIALQKLEYNINSYQAGGKTPPKSDVQLYKSIERALAHLKQKPFIGDNIQKDHIPKELQHLPNLFRLELSQFWRLLYYVTGDEVRIILVVFEICDHATYDRLFGYQKK